jgi:transcriptional regulator with XRE-family HTH domain
MRIRQRRRELGLSQREVASQGIGYAYVSRIEAGTRTPSVKALRKLAPKLGVSVQWLETGEEPTRFSSFAQNELQVLEKALRNLDDPACPGLLESVRRERAARNHAASQS